MPASSPIFEFREHFEQCLTLYLDAQQNQAQALSGNLTALSKAMAYSSLNGGKRLRAMLVYLSASCIQPSAKTKPAKNIEQFQATDIAAIAVELIHCYSLIHDDLPAMDDDDLRRGMPTNHKVYGEANAILAGDALQSLAFITLTSLGPTSLTDSQRLALIRELATASGPLGMVGGQVIDLALTDKPATLAELQCMHRLKTGALISSATQLGGICADASPDQLAQLRQYGDAIGLAFQIQDDLLDLNGDPELIGKQTGMDTAANKSTFPSLLGEDGARQAARDQYQIAINSLQHFGDQADTLRQLAQYIVERDR